MRIDLFLALRFIRDARAQNIMIASGVGMGVAVVIFLSSLIGGLQASLIDRTLGSQAHIVVEPVAERARPLFEATGEQVLVRRVERAEQRVRSIDAWQKHLVRFELQAGVLAVSPSARGPALALRGLASENVQVIGIDLPRFRRIIDIDAKVTAGQLSVEGRNAAIGSRLADALGVKVGDVLRLKTADDETVSVDVSAVFELGAGAVDSTWVLISLASAQGLLGLPGGATTLEISVAEVFEADTVAQALRSQSGLQVESWMESNAQLLTALRSQSASSWMIQVFVMLAVAIGIASVLVVSVVQRQREIGILRAMGVPQRVAQRVFLIQGALVGLAGSALGSLLAYGISQLFRRIAVAADGEPLFPIETEPKLFLLASAIAVGVGILSAVFPAARAAKLNPVDAIRHE